MRRRVDLLARVTKAAAGRPTFVHQSSSSLERDYEASLAATARAREILSIIRRALLETDSLLAEKDAVIASIRQSAYGAAIKGNATVGLLRADERNALTVGAPLFACRTEFLFCREVGAVGEMLAGEANVESPQMSRRVLRGRLVRLALHDASAVDRPVLYAGAPPLF